MKITSAITILSVLVVQQVVMASSGKATKLIEPSGVLSVPSRLFTDTTGKANKSTKKARNLQSKAKGAETGTYLSISTLSLPSLEEDGVEDDRGIRNEPSLNLSEKLSNDEPAYGYHVLQPKTAKAKVISSHRNLSGKAAVEALSFPLDVNGSLLLDEDVAGGYHVFNTAKTPKGEKKIASRKLGKAEKESYGKAEKGYHGYQVGSILY